MPGQNSTRNGSVGTSGAGEGWECRVSRRPLHEPMRAGRSTDGERWEFDGVLVRFGPARRWTGVKVPFHVPAVWGTRSRVAVRGSFGDVPLRGWVVPTGDGAFFLLVGRELRLAAGAEAASVVRIVLERADRPAAVPPANLSRPS